MTVVKLAALLVAASCGFRGGRIFPAVFVGVALGLTAHAVVPAVHPAIGVATGVLGVLLAITRQGWVSLFVAAALVASPAVIALLCIASLAGLAAGDRQAADAAAGGRDRDPVNRRTRSRSGEPIRPFDPMKRQDTTASAALTPTGEPPCPCTKAPRSPTSAPCP